MACPITFDVFHFYITALAVTINIASVIFASHKIRCHVSDNKITLLDYDQFGGWLQGGL